MSSKKSTMEHRIQNVGYHINIVISGHDRTKVACTRSTIHSQKQNATISKLAKYGRAPNPTSRDKGYKMGKGQDSNQKKASYADAPAAPPLLLLLLLLHRRRGPSIPQWPPHLLPVLLILRRNQKRRMNRRRRRPRRRALACRNAALSSLAKGRQRGATEPCG